MVFTFLVMCAEDLGAQILFSVNFCNIFNGSKIITTGSNLNFLLTLKPLYPRYLALAITVLSLAHAQATNKFLRRPDVIVFACHFLAYMP